MKIIHDAFDDVFDLAVEIVAIPITTIVPPYGSLCQAVQQTASGMEFLAEERLIDNRHFQHGYLQTTEERLHGIGKAEILKNKLEEHGDDIDGVIIRITQGAA